MKTNEIYTVTAIDNSPDPYIAVTTIFQTTGKPVSHATIIDAIKAAVGEYLETEDGKKTLSDNNGNFNYGDFKIHVPEEIMIKHGFFIRESMAADQVVHHNDTLVPDKA